jgi:hypothetical protein
MYEQLLNNCIAGCGKTVMMSVFHGPRLFGELTPLRSSSVIEDVICHCGTDSSLAYAYFFFDGRDSQKELQLHENLVRSLIRQLSERCDALPSALIKLYESCGSGGWPPLIDSSIRSPHPSLHSTLRDIMNEFSQVYVIIDSLDECKEREQLLNGIEQISTWRMSKLHLLVTSRDEEDIAERLRPIVTHDVRLETDCVNPDIGRYIDCTLRTDRKLKQWNERIQDKIKSMLMESAGGMYEYVSH